MTVSVQDSKFDPAAGGRARAAKMTPEERSDSARHASEARYKVVKATHSGTVTVGTAVLDCAVLPDGRRLLNQATFLLAIGRTGNPATPKKSSDSAAGGRILSAPSFLDADNLKPFVTQELAVSSRLVSYSLPSGGRCHGYCASLLPAVCEVYLAARAAGVLTSRQTHVAAACEVVVRGLARVGIVAMIDEATGYQEVRDRMALNAFFDRFLKAEFAAWAKRFPDEFYRQIFRLRGWVWKGMNPAGGPRCIAGYTKDIVYLRLAPGIVEELEARNPVLPECNGRRAAKHHQWLTDDVGHDALTNHFHAVMGLMRASNTWVGFMRLLDKSFPKRGCYVQLDFDDEA